MEQLLIHLFGDYFLQTDNQALNKKKSSIQCFLHCLTYSLPFLLIASYPAVLVIGTTHFLIDRWNFIPYLIAIKNGTKKRYTLREQIDGNYSVLHYNIENFGFATERPFAISFWLMVITDNTFHLIINYLAIKYL